MLTFNPSTGFSVTETPDLREQIAQDWKKAFNEDGVPELNTDPETPAGQLIDSQTASIAQKDAELAFLANQFNPLVASGVWQDALARIYFLERQKAINSSAVLTCNGRQGTVIAQGAQVRSSADNTLWTVNQDVTIGADGTATVTATCQTDGAIEAGANTLNQIVTITTGWDTVTNLNPATVGQLEETQSAFEARRYASVALNSRGAIQSVYARIAQLEGVLSVYTAQNRTNEPITIDAYQLKPHSIYVAVVGGNDNNIAQAIYNANSAGSDYNGNTTIQVTDPNTGAIENVTFLRPETINVFVRVQVQNQDLPNNYEALIKQAVFANFYGNDTSIVDGSSYLRIKMNDDVFASRFLISVLNVGIKSVLNIEVSLDGVNYAPSIHIPIDKAPTLLLENVIAQINEG